MLFLIILLFVQTNASPNFFEDESTTQLPSTLEPCGENGFRCIDDNTFQICALIDMDGNIDDPEEFHECSNGTNCDEANPAYCTPVEYDFQLNEHHNFNEDEREPREVNYDEDQDVITEMIETTTLLVTTTTEDDEESCTDPTAPNFDCESLGFFPDSTSKNLFWFCDVKNDGNGFKARHMKCGIDRLFDSVKKECVLTGTTRSIRREEFSCFNRKPGKYFDSKDCRKYFYCLPSIFGPFNKFEMKCPEETGYDRRNEKCNKNGLKRCED